MALNAATDADDAVRNRGVRLVANKLYGNQDVPELTAQVPSPDQRPAKLSRFGDCDTSNQGHA